MTGPTIFAIGGDFMKLSTIFGGCGFLCSAGIFGMHGSTLGFAAGLAGMVVFLVMVRLESRP